MVKDKNSELRGKLPKIKIPWQSAYTKTLGHPIIDKSYIVEQGEFAPLLFVCFFVVAIFALALASFRYGGMQTSYQSDIEDLRQLMNNNEVEEEQVDETVAEIDPYDKRNHVQTMPDAIKLSDMEMLYEQNADVIGWLTIPGMNVDYPIMQTIADEDYYLDKDFNGNYNANGCLILDDDSVMGSGTKANDYLDGTLPSTNLIVHGHNMKSGEMFGNLDYFRDKSYEEEHNIIKLKSLTEEREYEIVAVFLSQVYKKSDEVFKYYKFFEAYEPEEFDDFYGNIKSMQLYDTGVTASFGDEFITLSVCAYHVENGRLAIVGKRIK